ncbi:MAG: sulfatase-like hydrolase/transferase, partial [Gemmatimonadales bacterium]|nr:sulfatase-like hydrolase/transferase [Gemmatimonadales bacterium]
PDHFGCYGYARNTTPTIDRLAEESVVFEQHFSQATYTGVSTASLLTGQYPETHLVSRSRPLSQSAFTLARALEQVGVRTVLFSSNVMVAPEGPYGNGSDFRETFTLFELEDVLREGEERYYSPEPLLRLFGKWLSDNAGARFLAYFHFTPPHAPYDMPEEFRLLFQGFKPPGYRPDKYRPGDFDFPVERENIKTPPADQWINLYDSNLRYADWATGEVERLLREAGVFENTVFVVTADHGEAFGEHGWVTHGAPWHEEVTHIPLLIRFPPDGLGAARVASLTEAVDVVPTILDLFQISSGEGEVQGRSLLPLVAGTADHLHHYVFTRASEDGGKYVVRGERYSLLLWGNHEWRALYDLAVDPEQRNNVIEQEPERAAELIEAFRTFAEAQRRPPLQFLGADAQYARRPEDDESAEPAASPEVRKDLKALGYLK